MCAYTMNNNIIHNIILKNYKDFYEFFNKCIIIKYLKNEKELYEIKKNLLNIISNLTISSTISMYIDENILLDLYKFEINMAYFYEFNEGINFIDNICILNVLPPNKIILYKDWCKESDKKLELKYTLNCNLEFNNEYDVKII